MKSVKRIISILFMSIIFLGCISRCYNYKDTAFTPEDLLKENPESDFFIMDSTVYINAEDIEWINNIEIREGKFLGKITESGMKKNFKEWNSTKLKTNSEIYELEGRKDIILAKINNEYIPYLKYVEG